jgi:hypothetical protein
VHNAGLHDVLAEFAEQAAWQLASDTSEGAEVPFELIEESGSSGVPLYCYRPLTDEFIRSRVGALGRLPTYPRAARALEGFGGLENYLRMRGEPRVPSQPAEQADAVLRSFLGRVFEDSSDFVLEPERLESAYAELERMIFAARTLAQVAAPLRGLAIVSKEVTIGDGLTLVRADAVDDAPPEIQRLAPVEKDAPAAEAVAVLTVEGAPGDPAPITEARVRFRRLLTALRLYDAGAFALGPAAWTRIDTGPWQLVALGSGGRAGASERVIAVEGEDELRGFVNLIAKRSRRGGELAWALSRFEMGCERVAPFDALTDYLLALRALLEPEGAGSGRLARRLAAICAVPEERSTLAERVAHAVSLERAVIGGLPPAEPGVDAIVDELEGHLRALLRDVLCGHLDTDLVQVADQALMEGSDADAEADVEPAEEFAY